MTTEETKKKKCPHGVWWCHGHVRCTQSSRCDDTLWCLLNWMCAALGLSPSSHWVKWQMGQTLTKLLRSFKNVVHPLPPVLTPSLLAHSLKWPSLAEPSGQTSSLLAPRRLFSPQGEVIDYSATCDACLCSGDVAWDASSAGSASPTDEPLSPSFSL